MVRYVETTHKFTQKRKKVESFCFPQFASLQVIFPFVFCPQVTTDKEKFLYELDELQAQMEKAQLTANRLQTEKEDYQMDAERQREKCEKLQVNLPFFTGRSLLLGKEKWLQINHFLLDIFSSP